MHAEVFLMQSSRRGTIITPSSSSMLLLWAWTDGMRTEAEMMAMAMAT